MSDINYTTFSDEWRNDDENVPTRTSHEQTSTEQNVSEEYEHTRKQHFGTRPPIARHAHINYLRSSLDSLSKGYQSLDASRPWLVFWCVHNLALLGDTFDEKFIDRVITFLRTCRTNEGGYAGGPGQIAHLATTYAAVMSLVELKSTKALQSIDRPSLYKFILSRRLPDGSFSIHDGGENDVRGVYCAVAVASITNIITSELFTDTHLWTASCTTFEGGYSGTPGGSEAHGGYTYCALASLVLLGHQQLVHTDSLLKWLVRRQMQHEGGFNGRVNKLVDSCYSFWQGASIRILEELDTKRDDATNATRLFHTNALFDYALYVCQMATGGGMVDKPLKSKDLYHTNYCISGLAVAAHGSDGSADIKLKPTDSFFNVTDDARLCAAEYFTRAS